jgi:hypothetical protein
MVWYKLAVVSENHAASIFKVKEILKMKATSSSETPVNSYQTTRSHIPEVSHRHSNRRDNLKSFAFSYPWKTTMGFTMQTATHYMGNEKI